MKDRRLLPLDEMRAYMGGIPKKTVYNQLSAKTFPVKPVRVGRRLFWDRVALDSWIEREQRQKA